MPLPSPELDDRKFQDIVDEAKRLIPRYCPEWTNHNVSDPGVALIELFAWMSEMVLFRVNQVPERLYVHFLNMIGIEPFPPSVSRTDVTFWLSTVLETPVVVPEGTQVMTTAGASSGNAEAVVFTTAQDLVISPPRLVGAMTTTVHGDRAVDVWDNVRYDPQGVACFASPELTPGDAFLLAFGESLAGTALRITVEAEAEGIGVDPRTPPLIWEVWNSEAWLVCQVTEDTTGGLNRAGEIVLLVPVEHELLTVGNMAAYWLRVRLLRPEPGQPTYQVSPRVRTITAETLGGTVTAEHSENIPGEFIGRSDGRAAQSFPVSHAPVLPRRHDETVTVIDPGGDIVGWTEVADFSESQPDDRHFVWETGTGTVRFGPRVRYADGTVRQHGAIPRDGSEVRVTGYRHGGGARGNVGARTLTVMRSTVPFVRASVNLAPAVGGVDAESIAEAKVRAPLTLRTGQRAVTAGDYERLTRESSVEVARARCLSAQRGNGAVRMLVVPRVRGDATTHHIDDYAIGAPLLRRIGEHLDEHRLVGTSIEIGTPYYQGVSVVALVHAGPGRPAALVRQRVLDALTRYINPLTGGSDGEGWPFDVDINSAVVSQLIETVEGVERIDEVLLFEFDLRTGQRLGAAKDVIRLDQHSLFLSAPHQVVVR